jgi:hypothetical protein
MELNNIYLCDYIMAIVSNTRTLESVIVFQGPFTVEKVKNALFLMKLNKAPGMPINFFNIAETLSYLM